MSFLQNKFYNTVFIFRFFMNLQRQNVTNVTVKSSVESFWKCCIETIERFSSLFKTVLYFQS